jgi:DNA-binding LacI/PurR family transcriptional regulator
VHPLRPALTVRTNSTSHRAPGLDTDRPAARVVLRTAAVCDAFLCGNDQIARGVADALRESGKRGPDDIAVVGYDNWDVMAL